MNIRELKIKSNTIAYCHIPKDKSNYKAGIVFLSGYMSNMNGNKAKYIQEKCIESGREFLKFDYSGHGQSSGLFEKGTIGSWLYESVFIIKNITKGPQIIVGSSMGGWIALLLAKKIPHKVSAIIGIATAPDFPKKLWDDKLSAKEKNSINETGKIILKSEYNQNGYIFTKNLFKDAKKHMILGKKHQINCPVRLLQGMKDTSVSKETPLEISNSILSKDIEIIYIKNGDHRLSNPHNKSLIWREVIRLNL